MKRFLAICAFAAVSGSAVHGQAEAVPVQWLGTWALEVAKSTFGVILIPGVPADLAFVSQTLRLENAPGALRLSGETVMSDNTGQHSGREDNTLSLDGTETVIGPISLSFRPVDATSFEIVSKVNISDHNLGEVSRFSFSSDGNTLTETKTQTEREPVPAGMDKLTGKVIRASTFILVFTRVSSR